MIEEARHELKRADHLIFVSLKYTRTMDVLESTVKRLIGTIEVCVEYLLQYLLRRKRIKEIPGTYKVKISTVRDQFKKDKLIQEMLRFYSFLIRVDKAEHDKRSEFRKGVAMIAIDDLGDVIDDIGIDKVKDYYLKTIEFTDYVEDFLSRKK
jgi:hypothetical protein